MKTKLKQDMLQALKEQDADKKRILRIILGEIETQEGRTGKDVTDEQAEKIIRKMISSNEEVLTHKEDDSLVRENEILDEYLPKQLTEEEIHSELSVISENLMCLKVGQATGEAMKYLKSQGLAVDGKIVSKVVQKIKGGYNE